LNQDDKPIREARAALLELRGLGIEKPARAQQLFARIGLALDAVAADQHMSLFLAAYAVLQQRQHGGVTPHGWEQLWNAADALLGHYGITGPADVDALQEQLDERMEQPA
jgi:hypothetical protein